MFHSSGLGCFHPLLALHTRKLLVGLQSTSANLWPQPFTEGTQTLSSFAWLKRRSRIQARSWHTAVLCGTGNLITWCASCQAFELTSGWIEMTKMTPLDSCCPVSCKTSRFPLISGDFRDLTDPSLYWGSKTSSESNLKTAKSCDRTQDMPQHRLGSAMAATRLWFVHFFNPFQTLKRSFSSELFC